MRGYLEAASIPHSTRRLVRSDFPKSASTYMSYLASKGGGFHSDLAEGKGVNLHGTARTRSDLLAFTAKILALNKLTVQFVTLHQLQAVLEANSDKRVLLSRCDHLFIDWFEKDFGDGCPYTYYQLAEIEDFITGRQRDKKLHHFSTSKKWANIGWYSADFINYMTGNVTDISV